MGSCNLLFNMTVEDSLNEDSSTDAHTGVCDKSFMKL